MMSGNYFTGSFETLFSYWQDPNRAQKFVKGGTRVPAVNYLLSRAEVQIHKGLWIDTAVGAGYAQSQIYPTADPSLMVGIDFSRAMLDLVGEPVERILGSSFSLPIREGSASLSSNIFSLSDYPDPSEAFKEMKRITKPTGILMYLDYSSDDEYWKIRREYHGDKVVGNINLRDPASITPYLPDDMRVVENLILYFETASTELDERLKLPEQLTRAFLFVELYKPRSI